MLIGINGATTMNADLVSEIVSAGKAGYDGVEVRAFKIDDYLKNNSIEDLNELLKDNDINVLSVNAIDNCNLPDYLDFDKVISQCEQLCKMAKEIDCKYVIAAPPLVSEPLPNEIVFEQSVKALRVLTGIASKYGIKIGFEFLGFESCSVRTLEQCNEIVNYVGAENIGLVIDTFHFYKGGSKIESLSDIEIDKLYIVHINDAEDLPKKELDDSKRLLPSDGIIPLVEMLTILNRKGYKGTVSVELFRPEYWEWDTVELSKVAKQKIENVFQQAGIYF